MKNPAVQLRKPRLKRSPLWRKTRRDHLKREPVCRACGTDLNLEVHHIKPFHLRPELELDERNLITLCERSGRDCHYVFGHFHDWRKFNPNVRNDVVRYDNERRQA